MGPHSSDRLSSIALARQSWLCNRTHDAVHVPAWLGRSWSRCLDMGFSPEQAVGFEAVSTAHMRRVQEASQPLVQAARPVLDELVRAMGNIGYFAILTDAQGVVVNVHGPVDTSDRRAQVIARVGVDLSEKAIGTSAISTALSERQPVWLHRGEHFFNDTSVYSCAGAPIFGPHGECAGMLDLTGVDVVERPALKHLVRRSARSIENRWLAQAQHQLLLRLNWPGNAPGDDSDGLLTLDQDGNVLGANPTARQMLAMGSSADNMHVSELFALPWENLFDAARQHQPGAEVPLWSGLRLQAQAFLAGHNSPSAFSAPASQHKALRDVETDLIRQAVAQHKGNVAEAARALGISRATVYRKLGPSRH